MYETKKGYGLPKEGRGEYHKLVFQLFDKYFHYKTLSCDSYCNLIWNISI